MFLVFRLLDFEGRFIISREISQNLAKTDYLAKMTFAGVVSERMSAAEHESEASNAEQLSLSESPLGKDGT